jgi:hypothetical protein
VEPFYQPHLHSWSTDGQPLRLVEQTLQAKDTEGKALACYGVFPAPLFPGGWLVGRSHLAALCGWPSGERDYDPVIGMVLRQVAAAGQTGMDPGLGQCPLAYQSCGSRLDPRSQSAGERNRPGRPHFCLPAADQKPLAPPIEPKWVHGKRRIVEPDRMLPPLEMEERISAALDCPREDHLSLSKNVV